MSRTRTLTIVLALALALALAAPHLTGCERSPDKDEYANPFDPNGPSGGDGLQVRAFATDTVTFVSWDHHSGKDIALYVVDHRTDLDTEWQALGDTLVDDDGVESMSILHMHPEPNRTHEYLVQAITGDGEFSLTGYTPAGSVVMPPVVLTDTEQSKLRSRYLSMKIVVGQGDSLRVADNPAFDNALEAAAAAPGDTAYVTWDFGPRSEEDSLAVHVESFGPGGYRSAAYVKPLTVQFQPDFGVLNGVETGTAILVPSPIIDLELNAHGIEQMRFARTEADLATAPWVPGASVYEDFVIAPQTSVQSVWGEFQGDLGYNFVNEEKVAADLLDDAEFEISLRGNRVTTHNRVGVKNDAAALSMRFDDDEDFRDASWVPYAEEDSVDFEGVPGKVTIYAQFQNDWTDSAILSDTLTFVLLPVDIFFITPPDSAVITGGDQVEVSGRTVVADGGRVLQTWLDFGDGNGFSANLGLATDWSTNWTTPAVTESTERILRVRAVTDVPDTATAAITITLEPPTK